MFSITVPSFFIAHGAPLLAIQQNDYTHFLSELGKTISQPKAIVVFSAHWENPVQLVSHIEKYKTIHDFYGFPKELYDMYYPANGDHHIAQKIVSLLHENGISSEFDNERGLDHGAWVILSLLYPDANIPVISMSVNPWLMPNEQYNIGKALATLRDEDILIIGSGGSVHNLNAINFSAGPGEVDQWALAFDQWLDSELATWNLDSLLHYREKAPHVDYAVPLHGQEHFVPIFYAMGASDHSPKSKLLFRQFAYGNLSHSVWQFG